MYQIKKVVPQYNIPENAMTTAVNKGYIKARGVVVYPTDINREILCQGVLNPTVSKVRNANHGLIPYVQSSWFFRPNTLGNDDSLKSWEKIIYKKEEYSPFLLFYY